MNKRAETPEQKAEILRRVLEVWKEKFPTLRLGQLIMNVMDKDTDLWLIEDEVIAERLEDWAKGSNN